MSESAPKRVIVDETLMRGLVMRDIRPLLRNRRTSPISFSDLKHPIHRTLKPILWRAKSGRVPDLAFFNQFVRDFDKHVLAEALPVQTLGDGDLSRFPDHVFKTSFYFTLKPGYTGMLKFRSSSYWVHNGLLGVQDTDIFEIAVHALERFYQRTKMSVAENNANTLGREFIQRLGLFIMLMMPELQDIKSFGVPFADGLLLGEHSGEGTSNFTRSYCDGIDLPFVVPDYSRSLPRLMTFIGPNELSDHQRALIDKVRQYEKRHHQIMRTFSLAHHAQSELHRLTEVEGPTCHDEASEQDLSDAIWDFLALCLDDSSLRAVGSWDLANDLNERMDQIISVMEDLVGHSPD